MATKKHYFIEQTDNGMFAVRAKGAKRASALLATQKQAERRIAELNPEDNPNVERVRNVSSGSRDKWRSKR